jgi:hypothetical protein
VKLQYGTQTACKYCGQDIEWHGRKHGWLDRGRNRDCCPYTDRDGEIVRPKTKHTDDPKTRSRA